MHKQQRTKQLPYKLQRMFYPFENNSNQNRPCACITLCLIYDVKNGYCPWEKVKKPPAAGLLTWQNTRAANKRRKKRRDGTVHMRSLILSLSVYDKENIFVSVSKFPKSTLNTLTLRAHKQSLARNTCTHMQKQLFGRTDALTTSPFVSVSYRLFACFAATVKSLDFLCLRISVRLFSTCNPIWPKSRRIACVCVMEGLKGLSSVTVNRIILSPIHDHTLFFEG